MRVLLINSMCGTGSTGRIVADLYYRIRSNGDEAKVVYGIGNAVLVPSEDTYRINNKIGYYCHNLLAKLTDKTGLYSSIETIRLVRWIKNYDPDVIHLHNLHGYYINYKTLFEYIIKEQKKVVWTLHDCWSFTGHCAHFDMVKCYEWLEGCKTCNHINLYPRSFFYSNSARNYEIKKELLRKAERMTIVCPSAWLAKYVKQSFLSKHTIRIINNGIDLSLFYPEKGYFKNKNGLENKKIFLGVASNWNRAKGLYDFISLSKKVDDDTVIVLVGISSRQLSELSENMIGIMRTQSVEELRRIYSDADVFLNLTYEDTFPTVNMEALACGIPVVTYATGGCGEIVDDTCGRIVAPGSLDDVLNKVDECALLTREDCIRRAMKYSKDKKYDEYLTVYYE